MKIKLTSSLDSDAKSVECDYFKGSIFLNENNIFCDVGLPEDINYFEEITTTWGEKIKGLFIIKTKSNENPT